MTAQNRPCVLLSVPIDDEYEDPMVSFLDFFPSETSVPHKLLPGDEPLLWYAWPRPIDTGTDESSLLLSSKSILKKSSSPMAV